MIEIEDINRKSVIIIINDKNCFTYIQMKELFNYHIITNKYYILLDKFGKSIYTNLYDIHNMKNNNSIILEKLIIKFLPYKNGCVDMIKNKNPKYQFPNEQLKKDKLFVLYAVDTDGKYFTPTNISKQLLDDEEVIMTAALSNKNKWISLYYLPNKYQENKNFMTYLINLDGTNIKFASSELKDNEDFCKIAIKNNYNSFKYISLRLQNLKNIIIECIKLNLQENKYNNISSYISGFHKNDKDIMLPLVENNGDELLMIPKSSTLFSDKDIVYAAIKSKPHMFILIDPIFFNDRKFILLCLKKSKYYRQQYDNEDSETYEFNKISTENYYKERYNNFLYNINLDFLDDKEIILAAIKLNENNFKYASNRLKNDKDVILELIIQLSYYNGYYYYYNNGHNLIENLLQKCNHVIKDNDIIMNKIVKLNLLYIKYCSKRLKKLYHTTI